MPALAPALPRSRAFTDASGETVMLETPAMRDKFQENVRFLWRNAVRTKQEGFDFYAGLVNMADGLATSKTSSGSGSRASPRKRGSLESRDP